MDNLITGVIAVAIFLAFAVGLAFSIKSVPFAIIVAIVSAMILTDFLQSAKEGLKEEKEKKSAQS